MSTQAIRLVLGKALMEHPISHEEMRAATEAVRAIETALAVGHRVLAGDLHVVPLDQLNAAARIMRDAHEAELAREAE